MIISFSGKLSIIFFCITSLLPSQNNFNNLYKTIVELDKDRVINEAEQYLNEDPITITSFYADRTAGGIHDFYSEGDYW